MKVLVLTTETIHHRKFVSEVARISGVLAVVESPAKRKADFRTASSVLKNDQEAFESNRWPHVSDSRLSTVVETIKVSNINDSETLKISQRYSADLTLVYGTSILSRLTIDALSSTLLNLHGGDPRSYRGLDSHLWALYHSDWSGLRACLHHVEPSIDTGDLVQLRDLDLDADSKIEQLRALTTELSVEMAVKAIKDFKEFNDVPKTKQLSIGRYYSQMPAVLVPKCRTNLAKLLNERRIGSTHR